MLKQVVKIVSELVPPEWLVSRYGADQIAVILPGGDEGTVLSLIQRVQEAIRTYPSPWVKNASQEARSEPPHVSYIILGTA